MRKTAFERHLERCHATLVKRLRVGAHALADDIARTPVASLAQRALRAEVAKVMARHHAAFAGAFDEALLRSFAGFFTPPEPLAPAQLPDLFELEIMDDSRVQEEIEVAQVVQVLNLDSGVELRRLVKFEQALRRSEGVRVAASPIGPPALARAMWEACETLNLGPAARGEAVRSMAHWLAPRLAEIYAAVRQAGFADAAQLEAHADEPADVAPPTGFDVTRPGALFELLDLDEHHPVIAQPSAPAPIADTLPMPLDGGDPRIPGLIHQHRDELVALQEDAGPRLVLDLIGRLFDQILADPALSDEARSWLGRLHPSIVRLATRDATLLESHRHPVWTLVNRIATQMGADKGPPPADFVQWLTATVAAVAADPSTATFEAAGKRLTQWQRAQAERRLTKVEGALDLLRRNATLDEHVVAARLRLQRQLDSAQPPSPVKRFILTVWSLVVAQEAAGGAGKPAGAPAAMDIATDLIWSTDAARSRADSPTLLAMMPVLVDQLTAGMATVNLSPALKQAWLGQLAGLHLAALGRATGTEAAAGPITVDLKLDDEVDLPTRPVGLDAASPLAELQVGDTLGMQLHGDWVDLQLLWTSDTGQFLLFGGANGGSHSFTRTALLKMHDQGLLRVTEARSALERATDQIIRARH
jgi:hypothetical protein